MEREKQMSRRDELMKKNQNIRSATEISEKEILSAQQNHRPRSGQGSFAQRQRLEDRIRELETQVGNSGGQMIPVTEISPNPWQPRRVFDEEDLQKLAMSIEEIGLVQPIIVRSVSNRDTSFEIIAGERRYRAYQILGRDSIKAIILSVTDADMAAFALAENIDRTDLTAYEIAVSIRNAERMFPSRTSLASSLGLNRTALYKYLAFFKLPSFIINDLENCPGLLGRDAADAIASLLADGGDQALSSLQAVWPRVRSGDLGQGKVVGAVKAAMKNHAMVRSGRDIKKLFVGSEQAGTITRDDAALTIKIRAAMLTSEKEIELRSFVEHIFS